MMTMKMPVRMKMVVLRMIKMAMATIKMMTQKIMMKIFTTKMDFLIRRDQSCLPSLMFWTSTILTGATR